MKILVMDDEVQILRLVTEILQPDGHEVLCAKDGVAGMALFRKEAPEMVIIDIVMPEQEGIETILAIRRESPKVKIIAISGAGQVGDVDVLKMARAFGADDVIAKPFRAQELLSHVRSSVRQMPEPAIKVGPPVAWPSSTSPRAIGYGPAEKE
jgi:DNA-binding response OmpR family regulator